MLAVFLAEDGLFSIHNNHSGKKCGLLGPGFVGSTKAYDLGAIQSTKILTHNLTSAREGSGS